MMMQFSRFGRMCAAASALVAGSSALLAQGVPARAPYAQVIANDPGRCRGSEPAVRIDVSGIKGAQGNMRVQIYRAVKDDWLAKDRWIYRIEAPARGTSMAFCMPVPAAGSYAVAIRHDYNNNDDTDLFEDGGGMSNNPGVNIFNLGRPSVRKTAFEVGKAVTVISIRMRYL